MLLFVQVPFGCLSLANLVVWSQRGGWVLLPRRYIQPVFPNSSRQAFQAARSPGLQCRAHPWVGCKAGALPAIDFGRAAGPVQVLPNWSRRLDQSSCRRFRRDELEWATEHPVCDGSDRLHTHKRGALCGFSGYKAQMPCAEKGAWELWVDLVSRLSSLSIETIWFCLLPPSCVCGCRCFFNPVM